LLKTDINSESERLWNKYIKVGNTLRSSCYVRRARLWVKWQSVIFYPSPSVGASHIDSYISQLSPLHPRRRKTITRGDITQTDRVAFFQQTVRRTKGVPISRIDRAP